MDEKQKPKGTPQDVPSGQRGQSEPQRRPGQEQRPGQPEMEFPKKSEEEQEEETPVGERNW